MQRKTLLGWLGTAVLAGCTVVTGPMTSVEPTGPDPRAEELLAAGNIDAAVAVYAELYERSTGDTRTRYALAAAELSVNAGLGAEARTWLDRAEDTAAPEQRPQLLVLTAELALLEGAPETALELLDRIAAIPDRALAIRASATRGRAYFQLGRVEQAVRILVDRDVWLESDEAILANHEIIWNGLRLQTQVRPMVASEDPVIDGWLALLPVAVATRSDPFSIAQGLAAWRRAHLNHPALQLLFPELLEQDRVAQTYPGQVALLLPLRSLPQAAAALRDGFVAAYLRNPAGATTRLRVYDTDELGAQQAYLQAQLDGADFVVGPLLKSEVEQIAASAGFVPTLALNSIDRAQAVPANFFQFGLAPEDEAAEAARHAVANGARTAVALFPNTDWGLRLLASFQSEFETLGGQVLQSRAYDPSTQDFSLAITTLLNLSDSTQRYQRLAANLGTQLQFQPRRRQDVDMIFFAAEPRAGRLLAPQFRFHFAGDLPTYATSEVYDVARRGGDPDLNGVIFADTPWLLSPDDTATVLRQSLQQFWPQRTASWLRLYGLGFDAYRMIPMLYNGTASFVAVPGMSGELRLANDGRIRRRLPIAQFRDGMPVTLAPEDTAATERDNQLLSLR